jgi:CheY-like chemotaxis protein
MAQLARILVVDDDPAMVGAITALVGTEGHQVITAYDGLTAVKRYREERPDLDGVAGDFGDGVLDPGRGDRFVDQRGTKVLVRHHFHGVFLAASHCLPTGR